MLERQRDPRVNQRNAGIVPHGVVYESWLAVGSARDCGGDSVGLIVADGRESFELHVAPL